MLYDARSSNPVFCDNLDGWNGIGGGKEVQERETYVYLWLIHVDVWKKPTQYCKKIIPIKIYKFILKIVKKKIKEKSKSNQRIESDFLCGLVVKLHASIAGCTGLIPG